MAEYVAMIDRSIGPVSIHVDVRIEAPGDHGETREARYAGTLIGFLRNHIEAGIGLAHLIAEQGAPPADAQPSFFDVDLFKDER